MTQPTKDIGHTGLEGVGWGTIREDFLTDWMSLERKTKAVREMLFNSAVIGALRLAIEMPIRDVDWYFASTEGDDDPRLELLNESWDNMSHSWNDHIVDALLMVFYGFSLFSIVYERVNGRLLWRKFKMLGQDTIQQWVMGDDGGLEGVQQYPHLWPDTIPIERLVLYRFRKTKNNPEGESILRPAWTSWYYVKNIQHIEAIGIERNLAGLPVLEMPMGADPTESTSEDSDYGRASLIVRNIRNDEQAGIVLPPPRGPEENERWRLSLMSGGGMSKAIDTNMVISRYEKRMLMAAMAQFLMLGMDNVGALATFEGATDFFAMSTNAVADIIGETFSAHVIPRLMRLNGMDDRGLTLEHGRVGNVDLEMMTKFLQASGSLITWTPQDELWLRGLVRLPQLELDELRDLQEERRQETAAMRQAFTRRADDGTNEDDDEDAMAWTNALADYFQSTEPESDTRERQERHWRRKLNGYFSRAEDRILKGAREIQ